MRRITVLLADDHSLLRQGLRALLQAEDDIAVVGEAEDGRQAVRMARELKPNVIVMDISMPSLNGLDATLQIRQESPHSKVLILSAYSDDQYVERLAEAGAVGYLVKQTVARDLVKGIREANCGNAVFSPVISRRLLTHCRASKGIPSEVGRALTSREREVLQLIAEGYSYKEIAVALSIAVKTVEKHRLRLTHKLDIHKTAGLIRYAILNRIIETPHVFSGTRDLDEPDAFPLASTTASRAAKREKNEATA